LITNRFIGHLTFAVFLAGAANKINAASSASTTWTTPGGTLEGTRFSSLNQITDANVAGLVEEFNYSTGVNAYMEGQPLVFNNTMYVVGPFPNKLFAFDLTKSGTTRWIYSPSVSRTAVGKACCGIVNRGAALSSAATNSSAKDLVIYATMDNQVIAVQADTGARVWRTSMGSPSTGQTMTGAAFVVNEGGQDLVIVGNAGAELGVRGWVAALNAGTGAKVWMYFNTGSDADVGIDSSTHPYYSKDQGANLGQTTWPGTLYQHGGGSVWSWFTYDAVDNLVLYGTSNPAPWDAETRVNPAGPSDNKWSSAIVARNPSTGKVVWAYQVTPHDNWDFDSISESIVATIPTFNGGAPFLGHFDKNGFAYTLDAKSGRVLKANPFVYVNWAKGIDLTSGAPILDTTKTTSEGNLVGDVCPTAIGGKNYHPAAFSADTNLFYASANNLCANLEALKVNYIQGTPFMGLLLTFVASHETTTYGVGGLVAWDPTTGTAKWRALEDYPYVGGALATHGNLVFYGTVDGYFKAVAADTGKLLFSKQFAQSVSGNPITFLGADGKQRIAFYTGYPHNRTDKGDPYAGGLPPGPVTMTPGPGTLHVFKLP
jgi:alcohol dehydrogenase (cytochrome c)